MSRQATFFDPKGVPLLLWGSPLLFLLAAALLSSRIVIDQERTLAGRENRERAESRGLLYEISRYPAFSFGFRNFFADLSWLGGVQVAGARKLTPNDWRFPFYVGSLHYFSLGDPVEGGKALESAAKIDGSPQYLPLLAARMFSEGRKPETALRFLTEMMRQENDPARLEVLKRRIHEVVAERDMQMLERAVEAYHQKTGRLPRELPDLVREGMIARLPVGPPRGGGPAPPPTHSGSHGAGTSPPALR